MTLGGLRLTSVHFPGAPDRETQGKGLGPERGTGLLPGLQLRQQQGKEMGQDGAHPAPREAPGLENAGGSARRQSPGGRQDPPSFPTARFQDAHAAEPGPCFPDRLPGRTNMPHQQPGTGLLPQLQSCFYIGAAGTLSGPHPSNRETGRTGSVCVQPPPGTRVSWVAGAAGFPRGQGSEGVGSERWLIPPPTGVLSSSPSPAPAGPSRCLEAWGPGSAGGARSPGKGRAGYLGQLGQLWGAGPQGWGGRGRRKVSRPAGRRHPAAGASGCRGSQAQDAQRWPRPLRPSGWWTGRLRPQSLPRGRGEHSPSVPALRVPRSWRWEQAAV